MAPIKKRSLVDQVYERLRGDIITLRLPLGSKVNVNELQDVLGVSCTPIREAINRLQQEGLVSYENNVGAHVLTLTPRDVEEIQQLATTLHCGNRRLDRSMLAIQGQQLLLRNIYAAGGPDTGRDGADFERICAGVEAGDVEQVCDAITENAGRLESAVAAWAQNA